MRHLTIALATAASIALATPAVAGPTEDLQALMNDYWAAYLKDNPLTASSVGVTTYDRELGELSLTEFDRQAAEAQQFLTRLKAIPATSLSAMDQSNRAVLMRSLEDQIMLNRFGQRQLLYSSLGSYHEFLATMGENIPMRTKADYENYLARLALVPARMQAYSNMSVKAADEGLHAGLRMDEDHACLDARLGSGRRHAVAVLRPIRCSSAAGSLALRLDCAAGSRS